MEKTKKSMMDVKLMLYLIAINGVVLGIYTWLCESPVDLELALKVILITTAICVVGSVVIALHWQSLQFSFVNIRWRIFGPKPRTEPSPPANDDGAEM